MKRVVKHGFYGTLWAVRSVVYELVRKPAIKVTTSKRNGSRNITPLCGYMFSPILQTAEPWLEMQKIQSPVIRYELF